MTSLILFTMNCIALNLRVTEDEEDQGVDASEIGYYAYDYIVETETPIVEIDSSGSLVVNARFL